MKQKTFTILKIKNKADEFFSADKPYNIINFNIDLD
jgi:hypothetical protein